MAKLSEYNNLEEKAKYFEQGAEVVSTRAHFDAVWETLKSLDNERKSEFRGCSEARYKLFNSAQRLWLGQQLGLQKQDFHGLINALIEQCQDWNNKTVSKFFSKNGIHDTNNALAYLSYMQHYGVPTPLLDFTGSPFVGLYFAVQNAYNAHSSDENIDHYCSLYMVADGNPLYYGPTVKLQDTAKPLEAENNFVQINYITDLTPQPILFIDSDSPYKVLNNSNIVNQQGAFFFNNSPVRPLEEVYHTVVNSIKKTLKEPSDFSKFGYRDRFATCWNFHKNLRPYILAKLRREGVTPSFIFPNITALKDDIVALALEKF